MVPTLSILYIFYLFIFAKSVNIVILFGTLINFFVVILGLFIKKSDKFNFYSTFLLIHYLFFVLSPISQNLQNPETSPLFYQASSSPNLIFAFLMSAIFGIAVLFGQPLSLPFKRKLFEENQKKYSLSFYFLITILSLILVGISIFIGGGISNISSPRMAKEIYIPAHFWYPVSMAFSLFYLQVHLFLNAEEKNNLYRKSKFILIFLNLIVLLFLSNPINTARFILVIEWVPLIILIFPSLIYRKSRLILILYFGILFLMPILSPLRYGIDEALQKYPENFSNFSNLLQIKFIDIIEIVTVTIPISNEFEHAFFTYTLTSPLFFLSSRVFDFIPTTISLQLGSYLLRDNQVLQNNLSFPPFLEAFIDFSWIGIVFYGFLFGSICRTLENFFKIFNTNKDFPFIAIIFYASLPMIYRGPIRGIIGIPFLFMINTILIFLIFFKRKKKGIPNQIKSFAKNK